VPIYRNCARTVALWSFNAAHYFGRFLLIFIARYPSNRNNDISSNKAAAAVANSVNNRFTIAPAICRLVCYRSVYSLYATAGVGSWDASDRCFHLPTPTCGRTDSTNTGLFTPARFAPGTRKVHTCARCEGSRERKFPNLSFLSNFRSLEVSHLLEELWFRNSAGKSSWKVIAMHARKQISVFYVVSNYSLCPLYSGDATIKWRLQLWRIMKTTAS